MTKREKILLCAKKHFSKYGFEGCKVDSIAQCADVNKALIYYYFSGKKELFSSVMLLSIEAIHKRIKEKVGDFDNPEAALEVYIEAFYRQAKEDDSFLRMLMREIASSGIHLNDDVLKKFLEVLSVLQNILKNGVSRGSFKAKDAKIIHFIILGTLSFYLCSSQLRKGLVDKFPENRELLVDVEGLERELFELILKGLRKNG